MLVCNFGNGYRYLVLDIWFQIFVIGISRYLVMMGKRIPGAFYAGWRFGKWCRGRKPIFHNFVPFTSEHSSQCKFHQTSKKNKNSFATLVGFNSFTFSLWIIDKTQMFYCLNWSEQNYFRISNSTMFTMICIYVGPDKFRRAETGTK